MPNFRLNVLAVCALIALSACESAPASSSRTEPSAAAPTIDRTLVLAVGRGPESLGSKPLRQIGGPAAPTTSVRAFNAGLVLDDGRGVPGPYLAETLPALNTDSWQVLPDGRMETSYRLRPNLQWHDGASLTAEDFVFSFRVYRTPELGHSATPPIQYMEDVVAPDTSTVLIRWRQLYPDADNLEAASFPPLPRHLLESPFAQTNADGFAALPFWLTEYVGAGPFRVSRYELGTYLEGDPFDGHALGRSRIEHLKIIFLTDPNTTLANLLSGNAHAATDFALQTQQAVALDREWQRTSAGMVHYAAAAIRTANIQLRPQYANPRSLLDVRVRKALFNSTDRQTLADALTEGKGSAADILATPEVEYFAEADRRIPKYPFDPRRAEQLFSEAGLTKGADGFYASPTDGRFTLEVAVTDSNPVEGTVMVDGLRNSGIDAVLRVIPRAQTTEPGIFQNMPGILNGSGEAGIPLSRLRASGIGTPENRFLGGNYSGFNNPDFERMLSLFDTSLSRTDRNEYALQMMQKVAEEVPIFPLYNNLTFVANVANLSGPTEARSSWNLHAWYWTS